MDGVATMSTQSNTDAEYAENTYLHLREREPGFEICNGHDEFCEDEPMSALVTACVIAVAIACFAAVIYSIATN
jgi:hypothetical protein